MGPAAAVAAPHSSVTAIAPPMRVRTTRAPRARAESSPIARALSARASAKRDQRPSDDERDDRLQLRAPAAAERAHRPEVVLLQQLLVGEHDAVDHGRQRRADRRAGEGEPHGRGAAATGGADGVDDDGGHAAPRKANQIELVAPATPSDRASTTAAEAPALTPSRPGSASGLRVSACISAPATPIAAPTTMPEQRPRDPQVADDRHLLGVAAVQRARRRRGRAGCRGRRRRG